MHKTDIKSRKGFAPYGYWGLIDLFETLMSELGIDEDAALAVAFRGRHG